MYELSATPVLAYSAIARVTWRAPPTSTSGALKRDGRSAAGTLTGRQLHELSLTGLLYPMLAVRISNG